MQLLRILLWSTQIWEFFNFVPILVSPFSFLLSFLKIILCVGRLFFFVFSKRSEEFISLLTLRIVQKLFLHWLISKRRFGLICQTNIDMCVFRWIQEMWGDGIANFLLITGLFSRREMLSKTLAAVRQSRVLHPGGVKTFLLISLVFPSMVYWYYNNDMTC